MHLLILSGDSEDHFRFTVSHAEASLSKDGSLSEATGTGSPQRSTGDPLRLTEDLLGRADGALKSTEEALSKYYHFIVVI